MNTSEVLKQARQVIVDKGWCQGFAEESDGRVCMIGALDKIARMEETIYEKARLALLFAIPRVQAADSVSGWNDVKGRTKEEVLAVFDRAIQLQQVLQQEVGR